MSTQQVNQIIRAFPLRYSKCAFDELHRMLKNDEFQRDYIAWKSGINYKTNRKITIGGTIHQQLADKFMIQYPYEYVQGHSFGKKPVLFVDLIDIDVTEYLQQNEKMISDTYAFNAKINNHNDIQ